MVSLQKKLLSPHLNRLDHILKRCLMLKKTTRRAKKWSEVLTNTPVKERIEKEFSEREEKKKQRMMKKEMALAKKLATKTGTTEVLKQTM